MGCLLQENIPSVSMTSAFIIIFLFSLSISFLLSVPYIFFLSLFFQFLLPVSFYAFPKFFLLTPVAFFSDHINICVSGNQLWKLHAQIRPMLQVTSDAYNLLSASSGCVLLVRFLLWYGSILLLIRTLCVNSWFFSPPLNLCEFHPLR